LAASLKPEIQLRFLQGAPGKPVVARAVVVGPLSQAGLAGVLPAANVRIDVNLSSGKQDSGYTPTLEPNPSSWAQEPPYLSVEIGRPSDEWPPPEGDH
jgi:hypothetical protein